MPQKTGLEKTIEFLETILSFENGVAVLLGVAPIPSVEDMYNALKKPQADCGVRVDGGASVDMAEAMLMTVEPIEATVQSLGGWENIWRLTEKYREEYPQMWNKLVPLTSMLRPGGIIRDGEGGMSAVLSRRFDGVRGKTLRRWKKRIIKSLAIHLLSWAYTDGYNISYYPDKKLN